MTTKTVYLVVGRDQKCRIIQRYWKARPDEVVFQINLKFPNKRSIVDTIDATIPEHVVEVDGVRMIPLSFTTFVEEEPEPE